MTDPGIKLRGMILAAGYGTRLAPVTNHIPKPLLPVDGVPLLDRIIAGFQRGGVAEIGINTHHLGDLVLEHVARRPDSDRFTIFPEKEILGTGGALDGARGFLAGSPHFLLHNGDVLCDADLGALVTDHLQSGALATLLLVDWPTVNSVVLAEDGSVTSIAGMPQPQTTGRNLTYAGIGVFSKRLLDDIGPGFSSLIDPLVRALAADPGSVRGFFPSGVRWSDLGTLGRYLGAQSDKSVPDKAADPTLTRITGHGSDRKFWRLAAGDWSAVAMVTPPGDDEFDRFLSIAGFLGGLGLGVPAVLSESAQEHTVLMEDLGADSLYSLVRSEGFSSERVADAYRATVDLLLEIQGATTRAAAGCPSAMDRELDYAALRWETGYFRDRFLVGYLNMDPAELAPLEEEFHNLATLVAAQPRVLIHRDFQSQNILAAADGIRLVDFQGMRRGPLGYDLASLAFDPYVDMPHPFRNELAARFAAGMDSEATEEEIRAMVWLAGLQRVMQALGAYGFLGHVKGKREFFEHIPSGLAVLKGLLGDLPTGLAGSPEMPTLARLLASQG